MGSPLGKIHGKINILQRDFPAMFGDSGGMEDKYKYIYIYVIIYMCVLYISYENNMCEIQYMYTCIL